MSVRHFLVDYDISGEEQSIIINAAAAFSLNRHLASSVLAQYCIGLFFEKPSLRTRVSTERACHLLGAKPINLKSDELHFQRGETPADSIKVLAGYIDLFMGRVYKQAALEELSRPNLIPIVNGLSDCYHPLQALADFLTLKQLCGSLAGRTITYLGDGNNVCSSLLLAGSMAGVRVIACCPERYLPRSAVMQKANEMAKLSGGAVELISDPAIAVSQADAVYTDVWLSMGDSENERAERYAQLKPYQINSKLMSIAKNNCYVMHCLPAHRDEEITSEVLDSERSRVVLQAHNRLPTAMALFLFLLNPEACYEISKKA
ncbi:MAG: ornithine carbamoyltransferase [Deltaproteobacteria bacterium]|nr:ornithine carbamoyltransferase [Deltaproteobacteria bacterium]